MIDWVPPTLHDWSSVPRDRQRTPERGVTKTEHEQLKALEREVKEPCRANEILKLAGAFFAQAELDHRLKS